MFVGHLYVFFVEKAVQVFHPFFDWAVCFLILSCLHILEINRLSVASVCKYFSPPEGCVFVLFIIYFDMQQVLFLIRSHLLIFVFIFITLRDGSKKIQLQFMSMHNVPIFLSKSFIVPDLIFRSLIQFEFISVYGVRENWKFSNFILLYVAVQFSEHHLLKRLSFAPFYIHTSFVIDQVTIGAGVYLWIFSPVLLICISAVVPIPYCFDNCNFAVQSENTAPISSTSVFLSQGFFGYLGPSMFPYKL